MKKFFRYLGYLPTHWRTFKADFRYMLNNQRMCHKAFCDPEGVAMGYYDE